LVLGVGIAGAVLTTFLTRGEASGETAALFSGVQAGFLVASGVALLGAAISAIRGPERQKLPELAGVKPVKEKLNH
jgi:hypothetical protein